MPCYIIYALDKLTLIYCRSKRRMSDYPQEQMAKLLESAARLQRIVSGAVLVGGSAASVYAGHRLSVDHDHVISDLNKR